MADKTNRQVALEAATERYRGLYPVKKASYNTGTNFLSRR